MALMAIGSGFVCSAALAFGLGFVAPVSSTVGGLCELVAVAAGMVLIGIIDGD
jgi:hypothetical protein